MPTLKQLALQIRPMIEEAAESLTDNEALKAINLFQRWQEGKSYTYGTRVRYDKALYKCTHAHTSRQAWNPKQSPIMWEKVVASEQPEIVIEEWKEGTTYSKGNRVRYENDTWESTINNNIWTPGIYGWNKI